MSAIQEINNTLFMTTAIDCWHKLRKVLVQELFAKIVCHNIMVFTNFVYYIHFTYYILHATYAILDPSIRCKLLSDVFLLCAICILCCFCKNKETGTVSYSLSISYQVLFTIYKHCEIANLILMSDW